MRRTAIASLTEHIPVGYEEALLDALSDNDSSVRRTAAEGLRELVEMLENPAAIRGYVGAPDPLVRSTALYIASARRVGDAVAYVVSLRDPDHRVRIEAVRALVSVDDAASVATAATDENREVRIAVANGLAKLAAGGEAVRALVHDGDPLVRAAALTALGELGVDEEILDAVEQALKASAWQIRQGAVRALAGAPPGRAVSALVRALADTHLDVRKSAVLSLSRWVSTETAVREALTGALQDGDADVRAYARQALASV
ncbi:HEAT repeats family protein [Mycobacteroides abscessus MAB_082312_2258]|nr:HEAT repeats family protein [Mycobacteroides abscessus MAB_082312_2258]